MKYKSGLVAMALDEPKVLHFCGYEYDLTEKDWVSLIEELKTDEQFGLTDLVYDEDYVLLEATPALLAYYQKVTDQAIEEGNITYND